jgi:predicted dehydrogenase
MPNKMKIDQTSNRLSRRQFLTTTALAVAAPTILPSNVFGQAGKPAPSNRITLGMIGCGWQGGSNMGAFLSEKDCQVVAVCDVDKTHLADAVQRVNRHYKNQDCKAYADYRELCVRTDIDAVMIGTPDHWHCLPVLEAARNKKDIFGEKPLAKNIAEQQAMVKVVQQNKRIWQTGSWQRSERNFHKAAEIVRNGLIGKITQVEVGLPSGHNDFAKTKDKDQITTPPAELDYENWIGPSQMMPYRECQVHKNWRWNYNTGGGQLLDWVGHHVDIAHWGLGFDDNGPREIEGTGEFPPTDAVWNTCTKYRLKLKYPGNIEMVISGGHPDIKGGTKWIGTDGWVHVTRGDFSASNEAWTEMSVLPDDQRKVKLLQSPGHMRNFLDCVKSRKPTITPIETAHHSAIPGHLGLIAMQTGRKIRWDVQREVIIGDPEASKLLSREYRKPWSLG